LVQAYGFGIGGDGARAGRCTARADRSNKLARPVAPARGGAAPPGFQNGADDSRQPRFLGAAALDALIAYKGGPRQAWDHTDIAGPWLNGMRNTLNTQVFAFNEPNFLCVSGTHGPAHLALFDQTTWDKYQLAKVAGGNIRSNTFIVVPPAASHDPADFQSPDGVFSPKGNNIAVLQRRGVVFLACHNAIWELAERLIADNQNPDHLAIDAVASDLTNHLIPDAVLTPGVVPTLVKLQTVGFVYTR
jgi:hypothetical protein